MYILPDRGVAQPGSNRGLGPPETMDGEGHCAAARKGGAQDGRREQAAGLPEANESGGDAGYRQ